MTRAARRPLPAFLPLMMSLALTLGALARAEPRPDSSAPQPPPAPQPAPEPTATPAGPPAPVRNLDARLEALTPDQPLDYFELGEEILVEMPDARGRELARTLFLLAYELARAPGALIESLPGLQAGACLALAQLADNDKQKRQLLALADGHRVGAWSAAAIAGPAPVRDTPDAAFTLATALGLARAEDFARAAPILERPDVRALLERHGALLGGADALLREIRSRPSCRECKNTRIVRAEPSSRDAPPPWRLCRTCSGNPSLGLTPQQLLNHLRVEAVLLAGPQQAWSTQLLADGGEPLAELDPDSLASAFNIDPANSVYRDGRWTTPATAPVSNPAVAPGAAPVPAPAS